MTEERPNIGTDEELRAQLISALDERDALGEKYMQALVAKMNAQDSAVELKAERDALRNRVAELESQASYIMEERNSLRDERDALKAIIMESASWADFDAAKAKASAATAAACAERNAANAERKLRIDAETKRDAATAEIARLSASIAAWEQAFSSIEAHLQDRVAMNDPPSPATYLSIVRSDVGRLAADARAIYAATQHRSNTALSLAARLSESVQSWQAMTKGLSSSLKQRDDFIVKIGFWEAFVKEWSDYVPPGEA